MRSRTLETSWRGRDRDTQVDKQGQNMIGAGNGEGA